MMKDASITPAAAVSTKDVPLPVAREVSSVKASTKSLVPKNQRLDFDTARKPHTAEIDEAIVLVKTAGFAVKMERHLDRRKDAIAALSVKGLEVAKALRAFEQNHEMLLIDIARVINTFDPSTLSLLGMPAWTKTGGYDRVDRLTHQMAEALEQGFDDVDPDTSDVAHIDVQWFLNAVVRAPVPDYLVAGCALAVDGTDLPTWGALHGAEETVELDGEAALPISEDELDDDTKPKAKPKKKAIRRTAKVLGIGNDGRKIYTADKDARAGHRSATNGRDAGPYIGREAHLGVAVPALRWTDGTQRCVFGESVPQVIMTANLVPAGTHRAKAVIGSLLDANRDGFCEELLVDPGYSLMSGETFHFPLQQGGIPLVMRPSSHQRTKPDACPTIGDALVLDGQLFSKHTPLELRNLVMPARGASSQEKVKYQKDFEQRAGFAYVRHKAPGTDGVTRWRCPFCAGKLRSRQLPQTMRQSRNQPLVELEESTTSCCDGIISLGADQLALMQETIFGTTAWWSSYGRRNIAESANGGLKGGFTDINRGYVRSLITMRIILLFAHTLAGYNRWAIKSWHKLQEHLNGIATQESSKRKPRSNRLKRFCDLELVTTASMQATGPGP
jgi:hypothetical protein